MDGKAAQAIEAYRKESSEKVASEKKDIDDKAANEISGYRTSSESSVTAAKQDMDGKAAQAIEAYRAESSGKVASEKNNIDRNNNEIIMQYKKKKMDEIESFKNEIEQEIALNEEQRKLLQQSIKLKHKENAKLKKAIEIFLSRVKSIPNIVKNHTDLIIKRINSLDSLSKILGYTVGEKNVIDKLLKFREQLKADRRYGIGKRMIAMRQCAISALDKGINAAREAKEAKDEINFISDSLTAYYNNME